MAVITDVGDEKDIHPKRKEPVGGRLAVEKARPEIVAGIAKLDIAGRMLGDRGAEEKHHARRGLLGLLVGRRDDRQQQRTQAQGKKESLAHAESP